jgi:hypothetical protein
MRAEHMSGGLVSSVATTAKEHSMKKTTIPFAIAVALVMLASVGALATPAPNSVVINERVFNDCPTSVLTTTNDYPVAITIEDDVLDCGGFANLHNWRFSEDGGVSAAVFNNDANYKFSCTLVIDGTGEGEAGLSVSPWWSQDVDGRFNVRTTDGEIACFGGRLPFYSFTVNHGLTYVKGTAIFLQVIYRPNQLTAAAPATIEYVVEYNNYFYSSGPLMFDEGNPNENPPYGLWGALQDGRVGGYVQAFLQPGNSAAGLSASWTKILFVDLGPVSVEDASWGGVKALYR